MLTDALLSSLTKRKLLSISMGVPFLNLYFLLNSLFVVVMVGDVKEIPTIAALDFDPSAIGWRRPRGAL